MVYGAEYQECRGRTPGGRSRAAHRRVEDRSHPPRARRPEAAAQTAVHRGSAYAGAAISREEGMARPAEIRAPIDCVFIIQTVACAVPLRQLETHLGEKGLGCWVDYALQKDESRKKYQ